MENYRFHIIDKRWYVDLPDWTGPQSALEMVAGADVMLAQMAGEAQEVILSISKEEVEGYDKLKLKALAEDFGEGAYYILETFEGNEINMEMWLCDVMLYIFQTFPDQLFVKVIK